MEKLEAFYLNQLEPNKSCLLALRSIVLNVSSEINECVKYGMPCFCIGKKAFSYLWIDKKTQEPYILFVEGQQLNHPLLESGNRSRMKIFRINPSSDIPLEELKTLIIEAIKLCH